jgi:hypothetical protein
MHQQNPKLKKKKLDVKSPSINKTKTKGNPTNEWSNKKLKCFCWLLHTQDEHHYINF